MTGPQVSLTVPGVTWRTDMDPAPSAGEPHTIHHGTEDRVVGSVELGFVGGRSVRIEGSRAYLVALESACRAEIARLDVMFGREAAT